MDTTIKDKQKKEKTISIKVEDIADYQLFLIFCSDTKAQQWPKKESNAQKGIKRNFQTTEKVGKGTENCKREDETTNVSANTELYTRHAYM